MTQTAPNRHQENCIEMVIRKGWLGNELPTQDIPLANNVTQDRSGSMDWIFFFFFFKMSSTDIKWIGLETVITKRISTYKLEIS